MVECMDSIPSAKECIRGFEVLIFKFHMVFSGWLSFELMHQTMGKKAELSVFHIQILIYPFVYANQLNSQVEEDIIRSPHSNAEKALETVFCNRPFC